MNYDIEFRIVPYPHGLKFQVESRCPAYTGSDEWRDDSSFGNITVFDTEAEAEAYIDERLEILEARRKHREKVEKFAKDHPPRIYP